MIYFDHAATTPIDSEVYDFLIKSLKEDFANPSSPHKLGRNLLEKLNNSKQEILKLIKANPKDHFYFTSSATESNNTVIKGLDLKAGDCVWYSEADHKSIVEPISLLKKLDIQVNSFQHNSDGSINFEVISRDLNVKLIVLSHVNNQSGNIFDIDMASKLLKEKFPNAHLHIDMVQSFTKFDCKINAFIDSASFASHKIGGPKGIAGLYLKEKNRVLPLINGGGQQENFRPGTEAYSLEQAFCLAAKLRSKSRDKDFADVSIKSNNLISGIQTIIPNSIFPFKNTSPYIICFIIPKLSSDIILRHFEQKEIYFSSTSACSSKVKGFNPTLMALGIEEKFHKNVLRISISKNTTDAEIANFLSILQEIWSDLKYLLK